MKPIGTSPETLTAYAEIDYLYFALGNILKDLSKPRSPIAQAVDNAVGYDPGLESAKNTVECLRQIIANKKIIEADATPDEEFLDRITTLYPSLKQ